MAARRVQEDYSRGLDNYTLDATRLGLAAKMENDIVARRRAGNMARVQAEMKMQDDIAQREVALKNDQRICEESEELKELERRLKVAYMNKERAAQHEERILQQRRHQLREHAIDDQMECDRRAALETEHEKAG